MSDRIESLIQESEESLRALFQKADEIAQYNTEKVLSAFQKEGIAARHFLPSSGYGYGDDGRDMLSKVFADAFGAEAGLVSPNLLSGTHTLTVGLFGLLRPGDVMLSVTGLPYDTIRGVIYGEGNGSLKDFAVRFEKVDLVEDKMDLVGIRHALETIQNVKMVYIQRSRGYELRDAFSVEEIGSVCSFVRKLGFTGVIFVDNCYGEFTEKREPTEVGADVIAGSLIKNPGGGLAVTGGYICGRQKYIDLIAGRLTAPSIGAEVGSYAYGYQYFYQGFFLAPH
ncbi:MAG: methionine gamma-lyase family protein, partial [Christensenellaceae bacterium]